MALADTTDVSNRRSTPTRLPNENEVRRRHIACALVKRIRKRSSSYKCFRDRCAGWIMWEPEHDRPGEDLSGSVRIRTAWIEPVNSNTSHWQHRTLGQMPQMTLFPTAHRLVIVPFWTYRRHCRTDRPFNTFLIHFPPAPRQWPTFPTLTRTPCGPSESVSPCLRPCPWSMRGYQGGIREDGVAMPP